MAGDRAPGKPRRRRHPQVTSLAFAGPASDDWLWMRQSCDGEGFMRCPVLLRVLVITAMLAVDGRGLPQLVSERAIANGDVSSAIVFVTAEREAAGCCGTAACCCCTNTGTLAEESQDVSLSPQMRDTSPDAPSGCGCSARQTPDAPRLPMAPSPAGDHETSLDLLSPSNTTSLLCAAAAEVPRPAATRMSSRAPLQRQLALLCCWRT